MYLLLAFWSGAICLDYYYWAGDWRGARALDLFVLSVSYVSQLRSVHVVFTYVAAVWYLQPCSIHACLIYFLFYIYAGRHACMSAWFQH
jgi:hypothetical protein